MDSTRINEVALRIAEINSRLDALDRKIDGLDNLVMDVKAISAKVDAYHAYKKGVNK